MVFAGRGPVGVPGPGAAEARARFATVTRTPPACAPVRATAVDDSQDDDDTMTTPGAGSPAHGTGDTATDATSDAASDAAIDVDAIMRRVDAEVERRRQSGDLPADFEARLDDAFGRIVAAHAGGDDLDAVIGQAERLTMMTIAAAPTSARPVVGKAISTAKVGVQRAIAWNLQYVVDQMSGFGASVTRALRGLQRRTDELDTAITDSAAALERRVDKVGARIDRMEAKGFDDRLQRLERNLRRLRADVDATGVAPAAASAAVAAGPAAADAPAPGRRVAADGAAAPGELENAYDYLAFEDAFRGSQEAIAAKQDQYVALFRTAPGPVVDLGCGRGEFVAALRAAGCDAVGIDLNAGMVALAVEAGLPVEQADVLDWLRSRDDGSLGGIFLGQVVEHLSPVDLVRLVELASDKLAAGARFVAETINPKTLGVFAHALYVDPGHAKPVHPLTMQFLLRSNGFDDIEFIWSAEFPDDEKLAPVPDDVPGAEVLNANIVRLNDLIWGPQDYAVVGVRGPRADGDPD